MGDNSKGVLKLCVKGVLFILCLLGGLFTPHLLTDFFAYDLGFFRFYHLLWFIVMILLTKRLVPRLNPKISSGKIFERHHLAVEERGARGREVFQAYLRRINRGAARSAVYWTLVIIATGVLHASGILSRTMLFVVSVFFVFMDQFCVTVWCPFKWLIGNKCCNACRINNWGYFMAFSPLLFVPSFWTYSILLMSALVILQWEYLFNRHPERFHELYNGNLMCRNCVTGCSRAGRS